MSKKIVPFSRADYAKRRVHRTPEERAVRAHLTRIFGRKVSWQRVQFLIWCGGGPLPAHVLRRQAIIPGRGRSRQDPIIIE